MKKVETYSNWCYIDQLDGITLEKGESLRVRWPNGKETEETVVVMDKSYMGSDMGAPCLIPVMEAYVKSRVRGVKGLVRLAGQNILCERVAKSETKKSK